MGVEGICAPLEPYFLSQVPSVEYQPDNCDYRAYGPSANERLANAALE